VRVAATEGELALRFSVSVDGKGASSVGPIDLPGGAGTVWVDGEPHDAVVHERQMFPTYNLYQVLATRPEVWRFLWLYCRPGRLTDVYVEGTDGTCMRHETATGRCDESEHDSRVTVRLPAADMPVPPALNGFAVSGPDVALEGGRAGVLRVGSTVYTAVPFCDVDCTVACGPPGWREVHLLLVDQDRLAAGLGVLYLYPLQREVELAWALTLPDLQRLAPGGARSCANWTWTRD
jgi:hypothetical protein